MKKIVISVGGSLLNPGKLNLKFLKELKKTIKSIKKKYKIVIVTGGGHLAREYMQPLTKEREKDIIGIESTKLHASLLSHYLGSHRAVAKNWKELKERVKHENLFICGGDLKKIGTTSDGTSAEIAKLIKADIFINMTNVSGLYTKDPKKYKNAKLIPKISHKEFKILIDKHHEKPGQHFVLDKHAAKIVYKEKIPVIILKGTKELKKVLQERKFKGTLIS
ncbi:MAG: uridylate kinase [archaeon GW2011_AR17]|nr:MAG: uridylate kinase [archaeon GW2011_AR17]MBS3154385.1 UMP kinase [Candidatus Woesearchaeota archaeon]HIH15404.1 UMP kinase [Nanoarchaeota archaeon]HIH58928.1 UMP kinase [Nanoarchaeota archaeon]HII13966.1 UMP kinase [Nanoarchaeota archaeon]